MRFSREKKPTEPGWYWYLEPRMNNPSPEVAFVWKHYALGLKIKLCDYDLSIMLDECHVLFGDRIPVPSVETDDQQERGWE